jgi:hypothetical protein
MFDTAAKAFVLVLESYAAFGLVFAVAFVCTGVQQVDLEARGSGIGFRFLILPGIAAFWPIFLGRWIRRVEEPPVERNSHRSGVANDSAT